jgi:thymidylate synthase
MIYVQAKDANDAWRSTLLSLLQNGGETGNEKYYRDEVTLIEIVDPSVVAADERFPMQQEDLDVINKYIYSGENEEAVVHDWTKLYYHRSFDEPNSQIEFLINNLNEEWPAGEAQISMWDKNIDQGQEVAPCTQIIWGRIKHGKLELHVHTNSSDAYKKLLMNILEFISLQHYIARRVGVDVGTFYHFFDSCHLHQKDKEKISTLREQLTAT